MLKSQNVLKQKLARGENRALLSLATGAVALGVLGLVGLLPMRAGSVLRRVQGACSST